MKLLGNSSRSAFLEINEDDETDYLCLVIFIMGCLAGTVNR